MKSLLKKKKCKLKKKNTMVMNGKEIDNVKGNGSPDYGVDISNLGES